MKSLLSARSITSHIRDVLSGSGDDRHALVAFIGPDPLKWISHPKGLNVYCWPLAGATHPVGIDRLRKAGAKVSFVERLHAKVYHSDSGTVIGSANLSANALQGNLLETAVWLPPGVFSWAKQSAQVRKKTVYDADTHAFDLRLEQLRRDHVAFSQRNPRGIDGRAPDAGDVVEAFSSGTPTFAEWLLMPGRVSWQLGGWWPSEGEPTDTLDEFKKEVGVKAKHFLGTLSPLDLKLFVPTLAFRYTPTNGSAKNSLHWWFPQKLKRSSVTKWDSHPFVWMAAQKVPDGCSLPFDEKQPRFKHAFDKTVRKLGEKKIEGMRGPVNIRFLDTLAEFYAGLPDR